MESLAQLENLCERLYNSQDSVERAHAERTLKCFSVNTDYISQCQYILDNSLTPYALMLASSSLLKQVTEQSLPLQLRLDIRNYLINYLATRGPDLEPFVVGSLIQLLCRVTKFGWLDDDRFKEVIKEAMNFLSQENGCGDMVMKFHIFGSDLSPQNMVRVKGGGVLKYAGRRTHACGLWSSIYGGWESFSKHLSFVVGEGTCIRFWHDRWIGDNTLKDLYPELYVFSAVKDACISEVLWIPEGGIVRVWDLTFYRAFEDWELAASYFLFQLIQTRIPRDDRSDTLGWRLKGDGKFDIRSYYHAIRGASNSLFPWKGVWKPKIPRRVAFFLWTAAHGRILTLDNLMLKGRPLATWCCMCCCDGESVDHLLLHCPVTHSLWTFMLQAFGIHWVMPGSVAGLLSCWHQWLGKHNLDIWNLVLGCLMWIVWLERNRRSFEDIEKTLDELKAPYHCAIGLKILNQLVSEMNQTNSGLPSMLQRKIAISFKDQSLFQVFQISLTSLHQLKNDVGSKLQELVLSLSLNVLSFDFMGTSFDESSDEIGMVQIPISWRPVIQDSSTLQIFFDYYAITQSHFSKEALECLLRLASIRRSFFINDATRLKFLSHLMTGTKEILQSGIGLADHDNYHSFCRLLGRFKVNYQSAFFVARGNNEVGADLQPSKEVVGKWLWRYGMETDVLWRRVIEAKYGNIWGGWCTKKVTSPYGVSLWRYIRSGWLNFSKFLVYDVGDGTRVKFWKHVWCGDCTLQEAFPKLYHLSRSKDSSVAEVMGWFAGRFNWNVQFLRPPQDWEEEAFDRFMELVYSLIVRGFGPDKVCWKPARNRGFEVRGYYSSFYPPTFVSFPWRMIWQSKLSELVNADGYADWIRLVADFTLKSLHSWQWAGSSVYYLLGMWSRLVTSVRFLKTDTANLLDEYAPKIIEGFISSRFDSLQSEFSDELSEDPLDNVELLQDQLDFIPYLCRFQYETCGMYIVKIMEPILQLYMDGANLQCCAYNIQLSLAEVKLAWIVHIVAAILKTKQISGFSGELQEVFDAELSARVWQLINVTDSGLQSQRYGELSKQRLDCAILTFLQQFRKSFVGDYALHSSKQLYARLSELLGIHDHLLLLVAIVRKIVTNLKSYSQSKVVIDHTLSVFLEMTSGSMLGKLLLKLDIIKSIISHHDKEHFPFLDDFRCSRSRTTFYFAIAALIFMEDSLLKFKSSMDPLLQETRTTVMMDQVVFDCGQQCLIVTDQWLTMVFVSLESTSDATFHSDAVKYALIGLMRDLRGIAMATKSHRTYCFLFDWLYPARLPLLLKAIAYWTDTPEVCNLPFDPLVHTDLHEMILILPFSGNWKCVLCLLELALATGNYLVSWIDLVDLSTMKILPIADGITLLSDCVNVLLSQSADILITPVKVTTPLLKFIAELVLNKSERLAFDSSSPNGILLFREVSKLTVAYGSRILPLQNAADMYTFKYKGIWICLTILTRALAGNYVNFGVFELYGDRSLADALDVALRMILSIPLADVLKFRKLAQAYFAFLEILFNSHMAFILNLDTSTFMYIVGSLEAGLKGLIENISTQCASAVDKLATFYFIDIVTGESPSSPAALCLAQHITNCPGLFQEILSTLFEIIIFGDGGNQRNLSRPMLSLILINEELHYYNIGTEGWTLKSEETLTNIKGQILASHPPDQQQQLSLCFEKLMADITRSLDLKNRDKFTQNLIRFKNEFRSKRYAAILT
uniref:Importin N-terminal domain-containing protein n=1 Tax=Quercus lobata TaxID=97700 RepID=A0A7N2M263_QUELO